jgi:hypothetical protein
MIREPTTLVLGRGQVFFDPFLPGTLAGEGERYIGNTISFRIQRTVTTIARNAAYKGQRVDIGDEVIGEEHTVTFITDHVSLDNIATWYGMSAGTTSLLTHTTTTESIVVKKGRHYQLGKTVSMTGARNVAMVEVRIAGVLIPEEGNYSVDEESGRIYVLPNTVNITQGATLTVKFEWRAQSMGFVQSTLKQMEGALRFVAKNQKGPQRNYFFPRVRLSPQGQVDLKGDEFQQVPFMATALRLGPEIEQLYTDEPVAISTTANEELLLDNYIRLSEFPPLENLLDVSIAVTLGSHGY